MANTTAEVTIVFDRFPELAGQLRQQGGQLTRRTALAIRDEYRQTCRRDTGAQAASAYVVTNRSSTYGQAVEDARSANPGVELLPEVEHPDPYHATVAVAAAYAGVNEFGGHGRAGDGALTKADEAQRQTFQAGARRLLDFQASSGGA